MRKTLRHLAADVRQVSETEREGGADHVVAINKSISPAASFSIQPIQFAHSPAQRVNAVVRQNSVGSSPLKQRFRRSGNQLVPAISCPLVVGCFVHYLFIQTKNPCLYIALGNQLYNVLIVIDGLYSTFSQRLTQLRQSAMNGISICIKAVAPLAWRLRYALTSLANFALTHCSALPWPDGERSNLI
jgi:hypothetical protein